MHSFKGKTAEAAAGCRHIVIQTNVSAAIATATVGESVL